MTYLQVFQTYEKQLARPEELRYVYRYKKKLSYTAFILLLNEEVVAEDLAFIKDIYERLAKDEPAQYIVGDTEFCGLTLNVDARALIPRPETEELVQLILAENTAEKEIKLLDIGTGTGGIALSVAKVRPKWEIDASDISSAALSLAADNAKQNEISSVSFVKSDVFSNLSGCYDIIVSNPPYIAEFEKADMADNVLNYEPHLALFAAQDGLAIYVKIAEKVKKHLKDTGKLYLEIGYLQGKTVSRLFKVQFPDKRIRLIKDLSGKDRMIAID